MLRQDILDRALQPLTGAATFEGFHRYDTGAITIRQAILDVVRRAERQQRHIVSWSRYDATAIWEHGSTAYNQRILRKWYRDGKATARRWKTLCRPDLVFTRDSRRGTHQLSVYLDAMGYELPEDYGKGTVGARLRDVRTALSTRLDWNLLTSTQQAKWLSAGCDRPDHIPAPGSRAGHLHREHRTEGAVRSDRLAAGAVRGYATLQTGARRGNRTRRGHRLGLNV